MRSQTLNLSFGLGLSFINDKIMLIKLAVSVNQEYCLKEYEHQLTIWLTACWWTAPWNGIEWMQEEEWEEFFIYLRGETMVFALSLKNTEGKKYTCNQWMRGGWINKLLLTGIPKQSGIVTCSRAPWQCSRNVLAPSPDAFSFVDLWVWFKPETPGSQPSAPHTEPTSGCVVISSDSFLFILA